MVMAASLGAHQHYRLKRCLLERKQHNLWMGSHAHGRAPGAGPGGRADQQCAEAVDSMGKLSENAACEPIKRSELSPVGVA